GCECPSDSVTQLSADQSYYLRSPAPPSYGTISLPMDEMASLATKVGESDWPPPRDCLIFNPSLSSLARLQRLHAAAGQLAEDAPEIIANPEAARGLEQALIEAVVECVAYGERREPSLAQGQHTIVMRRFHRVVEQHVGEPLYIPEICKTIGVSERTLRNCCQ